MNKDIKRVTGLGGFFFKSQNPNQIKDWYKNHLGIPIDNYGWTFWWKDKEGFKILCSITKWKNKKN
jgi:hypothetical protein